MNMKRFLITVMSCAVLFAHAGVIKAGAVSELTRNEVNQLEDDNFESFFNEVGSASTIDVGDRFLGVISIQALFAPPGVPPATYIPGLTNPTFTAVFALETARVVTTAANTFIYFKPVTTDWSTAFGLDLPDVNANTIAVFYDDVEQGDLRAATALGLQASIDTYVGNNRVWEFGFNGADLDDDGVTTLGEFFVAVGNVGINAIGTQLSSIANIINLGLVENFTSIPLLKHDFLKNDAVSQGAALLAGVSFDNDAELQGSGQITTASSAVVWDFKTDTDLYIFPIPEPSSMVLWGIGALGLGLAAARRRKQVLVA